MPKFNPNFPETFNFTLIDNHSLSILGTLLKVRIMADLQTPDRNLTPGLREALNQIAKLSDI